MVSQASEMSCRWSEICQVRDVKISFVQRLALWGLVHAASGGQGVDVSETRAPFLG